MTSVPSTAEKPKKKKKTPKTRQLLLDPSAWNDEGKSLSTYLAGLEEDIVPTAQSHPPAHPPLSTIRTLKPSPCPPSIPPPTQPGEDQRQQQQQPPRLSAPPAPNPAPAATAPRLYVEGKRRFTAQSAAERALEEKRRGEALKAAEGSTPASLSPRSDDGPPSVALIHVALLAQKAFLRFAHFCHGLLAGFAFWQCVTLLFLYHLAAQGNPPPDPATLVDAVTSSSSSVSSSPAWAAVSVEGGLDFVFGLYSALSKPTNCVFVFLLTMTTLAALDDADVASSRAPSWLCSRFVSFSSILRAFVLPALLLSFITNNVLMQSDSQIRWDEKLNDRKKINK